MVPTSHLTQIAIHLHRVILLQHLNNVAGVAAQSTRLATTCVRSGVLGRRRSLSTVPLLAFLGRQEDVLGRILVLATDTVWKWLTGFSWPSTHFSLRDAFAMVFHMMVQRTGTAWFSRRTKTEEPPWRALVCRNQVIFGLPKQSLVRKHFSFRSVRSKFGGCAGLVFLLCAAV